MEKDDEINKEMIKKGFEERYRKIFGPDYDLFLEYSFMFPRRAIRVNTLRGSIQEVKEELCKIWKLEPIPWCKEGFWIEGERRDIGNHLFHQLGKYYVQEPASMIPAIALGPQPDEFVIDMAAAPGSKTTQIAAMMKNRGCIIANEIDTKRLKMLNSNLQRCFVMNTIITNMNGIAFANKKMRFDRVLIDAPCSGTGTIRKSFLTLRMWNERMIEKLSRLQLRLLENGFEILKRGGVVVYSTCSLEPFENERVISMFLKGRDDAIVEEIEMDVKRDRPILEFEGERYDNEVRKCLRISPQRNNTDGFFVCRIKKK
ncbi:MAG: tRNA (cytosine49-C5)-methyltransferase [Candidatus Woesearchaeota archaeon]|nr:tRNA (cytosine49-C5)-methyltransferase [Candidatus Woesearchaeota archaeon]